MSIFLSHWKKREGGRKKSHEIIFGITKLIHSFVANKLRKQHAKNQRSFTVVLALILLGLLSHHCSVSCNTYNSVAFADAMKHNLLTIGRFSSAHQVPGVSIVQRSRPPPLGDDLHHRAGCACVRTRQLRTSDVTSNPVVRWKRRHRVNKN